MLKIFFILSIQSNNRKISQTETYKNACYHACIKVIVIATHTMMRYRWRWFSVFTWIWCYLIVLKQTKYLHHCSNHIEACNERDHYKVSMRYAISTVSGHIIHRNVVLSTETYSCYSPISITAFPWSRIMWLVHLIFISLTLSTDKIWTERFTKLHDI